MADADIVPPDMRLELQKFDEYAEQITKSLVGSIEASPPPPIIYHYTNDIGLRGILETGRVWLTDIFSLNDPSELSHGFSHVVKILNDRALTGPSESKLFARQIQEFLSAGGIQESAHYFACSFSAAGDDLGQWRAYADNGRGYALGFDARALERAFTHEGDIPIPHNSTFPVTYEDAKLAELHRRLVDRVFPLISLPCGRELGSAGNRVYMGDLFTSFAVHALSAALFFKHEAYSNEREYRFLQVHRGDMPPPDVKFRSRPYSLVRYREFDWRGGAAGTLKKIVIGPAANKKKAVQFVADRFRAFHGTAFDPTHSTIPYKAV